MTRDDRTRRARAARLPRTLVAAALLVTLVLAGYARGQGLPLLPDPIDTHTLMQYADLMELSDQQRAGLAAFHDEYLVRSRDLRDSKIQAFQDDILDIGMRFGLQGFSIPERAEVEHVVSEHDRLLGRISRLDRDLLDGIGSILTEQQMPRLERVRTLREIQLYWFVAEAMSGDFNRGAGVHLSALLDDVAIDPEQAAPLVDRLVQYETALLRRRRSLYEAIQESIAIGLDSIDEWGLREMELPELMQLGADEAFQQRLRDRFDEGSLPFQMAAAELSELNLRTFRLIEPMLSKEARETARDRYYTQAYGAAYDSGQRWRWRVPYHTALKLDLPPELREQVELELQHFARQQDEIDDKLVDLVDASRRRRTVAQLEGEEPLPGADRIEELRERRREIAATAVRRIETLVGADRLAEAEDDGSSETPDGDTTVVSVGVGGGDSTVTVERRPAEPQRVIVDLPPPIPASEVSRYVALLGWSGDNGPVVSSLFDLYRESYDRLRAEHEARLAAKAGPGNEAEAVASGAEDEPEEEVDPLAELSALEASLFDDLAAIAVDDDARATVRLLRLERQRQRGAAVADAIVGRIWESEATVDLVGLVCTESADPAMVGRVAPVLDLYAGVIDPLLVEQLEVARAAGRTLEALTAAQTTSGEAAEEFARRLHRRRNEEMSRMREIGRQLTRANRDHLGQLESLLTEPQRADLRERYMREAHPEEFVDAKMVERLLEEAVALPDLSTPQRERLIEATLTFRQRYLEITRAMIEVSEQRDFSGRPDRAAIEREIDRERMRFDRNETGARAILAIRAALSEMQEVALPDLRRWEPTGAPWE